MSEGGREPISSSSLTEYRILREGCALLERSGLTLLAVAGEDRQRFANGLVTCDVRGLEPGQGVYGFFTDVRGHVLADVVVRALEDRLWLELPVSTKDFIASHLARYVVADRVEVLPRTDRVALSLAGARAGQCVESLLEGVEVPAGRWSIRSAEILGRRVMLASDCRMGVPAFIVWASEEAAAYLVSGLVGVDQPAIRRVSPAAAEVVRIEEGVPRFGNDFGADNLPQETGIEEAVSYIKGCYLGQEVVARLHYRGQAARLLRRVGFEGPHEVPAGAALFHEGRQAGRVTSVAASPESGRVSGLAMLQRRAGAPGTRLTSEGGATANVSELAPGFGAGSGSDRE